MDSRVVQERQRLALARIEDAAHRLATMANLTHIAREAIDENDMRQAILRETEITADALNSIVVLLTSQPVLES